MTKSVTSGASTKQPGHLVLSLREGEYVMIGDAKVTIGKGGRATLAISAPAEVRILRGKVLERNAS